MALFDNLAQQSNSIAQQNNPDFAALNTLVQQEVELMRPFQEFISNTISAYQNQEAAKQRQRQLFEQDLYKLDKAQGFDLDKLNVQQKNTLEQLATQHGYGMEDKKLQYLIDLAKGKAQHGYNKELKDIDFSHRLQENEQRFGHNYLLSDAQQRAISDRELSKLTNKTVTSSAPVSTFDKTTQQERAKFIAEIMQKYPTIASKYGYDMTYEQALNELAKLRVGNAEYNLAEDISKDRTAALSNKLTEEKGRNITLKNILLPEDLQIITNVPISLRDEFLREYNTRRQYGNLTNDWSKLDALRDQFSSPLTTSQRIFELSEEQLQPINNLQSEYATIIEPYLRQYATEKSQQDLIPNWVNKLTPSTSERYKAASQLSDKGTQLINAVNDYVAKYGNRLGVGMMDSMFTSDVGNAQDTAELLQQALNMYSTNLVNMGMTNTLDTQQVLPYLQNYGVVDALRNQGLDINNENNIVSINKDTGRLAVTNLPTQQQFVFDFDEATRKYTQIYPKPKTQDQLYADLLEQ